MKYPTYLLLLLGLSVAFTSCRKEEDETPDTTPETGNTVSVHNMDRWGSETFELNTNYAWGSGHVRFQEIRFYLTDFHLHGDASDEHAMFMNDGILVEAGTSQMQTIGTIDFDHVHTADLLLGLNETLNHQVNPAESDAPFNDGSMHWGWNPDQGYKFIKVEGEQDVDGDGSFEAFSIHAATDNLKRDVSWSLEQEAVDKQIEIHVAIDYAAMFDGVDFGNLSGTHGDSPLTNQIADQLATALTID